MFARAKNQRILLVSGIALLCFCNGNLLNHTPTIRYTWLFYLIIPVWYDL